MNGRTFGGKAFRFYASLRFSNHLPRGVTVMNPYRLPAIRKRVRRFLEFFFSDRRPRVLVFGINPGRFGSGVTGVTFTDPVALEEFCGIPNDLKKRRELSSEFIYEFIRRRDLPAGRQAAVKKFYRDFFLTAVSPLGFRKGKINFNFYDDPKLLASIRPFLLRSLEDHLAFGARRNAAIVLGSGKLAKIFRGLNAETGTFKKVYALEHPRFIMQYRRKQLGRYLKKYERVFRQALKS